MLGGVERARQRALHEGPAGRLEEVIDGAIPGLAVDRVLGQRLGVAREPPGVETFHGAERRRMELPPSIVKQTGVGDLVRQRVLERVLDLGEQARLVEEFRSGEPGQRVPQDRPGDVADLLEHGERDAFAHDGGGLQHPLVVRAETIDARGEDGVHRPRHVAPRGLPPALVGAADTYEHAVLHEVLHHLLDEEWIALRPGEDALLHAVTLSCGPRKASTSSVAGSAGNGSSRSSV